MFRAEPLAANRTPMAILVVITNKEHRAMRRGCDWFLI
jgi:hypothetical protein